MFSASVFKPVSVMDDVWFAATPELKLAIKLFCADAGVNWTAFLYTVFQKIKIYEKNGEQYAA